jgi:hypothetical protein
MPHTPYNPPPFPDHYEDHYSYRVASLWNTLDNKYDREGNIDMQRKYRIAAYQSATRNANKNENLKKLAYALKWRLNQWDDDQRKEWNEAVRKGWEAYRESLGLDKTYDQHKKPPPKIFLDWPK